MNDHSEFSSNPVSEDQLVPWPRVAAITAMVAFSLPVFITGLEIYQGMTAIGAMIALIVGSVIITIIGAIMGSIGAKTRLSSYLLVRIAFGDKGAGFVNMAFAISLLGWFGVNIDLFSDAVLRLSSQVFDIELVNWHVEAFAGIVMTITTAFGFRAINILASLMAPVLAIVTALMVYTAFSDPELAQKIHTERPVSLTIGEAISAVVGGIIIGAIILPDITRFIRKWQGAIHTVFWSYMVVELVVLIAAGLGAAATGRDDILDVMLDLGLGVSAFAIVIFSSWILNSLNLYSAVLGTKATFPTLKDKLVTFGLGALGIGAAFLNILDVFLDFLFFLAVIFVPVAGVIIADYLLIRPNTYRAETLANNRAISLKGFIAWLIGSLISALGSFEIIPAMTTIAAIDAILVSLAIYLALSWSERTPKSAKGAN